MKIQKELNGTRKWQWNIGGLNNQRKYFEYKNDSTGPCLSSSSFDLLGKKLQRWLCLLSPGQPGEFLRTWTEPATPRELLSLSPIGRMIRFSFWWTRGMRGNDQTDNLWWNDWWPRDLLWPGTIFWTPRLTIFPGFCQLALCSRPK